MKLNKSLLNECLSDDNVGYNTKMEGYTTSMSDMKELGKSLGEIKADE